MMHIYTKVLMVWAALASLGIGSLQAQEAVRKAAVPPAVVEEFEARFAEAENVAWLRQGEELYGARFQVAGHATEAIFTPAGEWIQTEQDIPYLDMPDDARNYCRSNYPDYQAKAVKKVSTRKYGILYEIKVLGGMKQVGMTFDMHGRLVEEKEEAEAATQAPPGGVKDKFSKLFKKGAE